MACLFWTKNKELYKTLFQIVQTPRLELDLTYGLISCPASKLKVLDMSEDFEYLLTKGEENLVSIGGAYENSFQIGEFCLDLATTDNAEIPLKRIAVTCDPCQGSGRSCIKTCCPHFQISQQAEDGSFRCVNQPGMCQSYIIHFKIKRTI